MAFFVVVILGIVILVFISIFCSSVSVKVYLFRTTEQIKQINRWRVAYRVNKYKRKSGRIFTRLCQVVFSSKILFDVKHVIFLCLRVCGTEKKMVSTKRISKEEKHKQQHLKCCQVSWKLRFQQYRKNPAQ